MKFGRVRGVVEAARIGQLKESSIEKHLCGSLLGTLTVVPKVISICVRGASCRGSAADGESEVLA